MRHLSVAQEDVSRVAAWRRVTEKVMKVLHWSSVSYYLEGYFRFPKARVIDVLGC